MPATPTPPAKSTAVQADAALKALQALPRGRLPRKLRVSVPKQAKAVEVTVPAEAFDLFLEVLGQLASGNAVKLVPARAELTTQQAAAILNVSRPYLIRLLENGEITFSKVGSHRRVKLTDILDYKERRDADQKDALRELTREAQKLKLGY
jgi:excisionase family DNA binding protein